MNELKLSVIIPALNEEQRIGSTLQKVFAYLKANWQDYEVIVVDDGCTDRTREVVRNFEGVVLTDPRKNLGKGYSIRQGMLLATGDLFLFSDADLSTPIAELDKFLPYLSEYGVVIGTRLNKKLVKVRQSFFRESLGKFFNLLVQFILIKGIRDTQCGFKLFKRDAAKTIFSRQKLDRFGFDVEVLFLAKKFGFKIKPVNVLWFNDERSKVSPVKDSVSMFKDIFRVRWNDLLGRYRG